LASFEVMILLLLNRLTQKCMAELKRGRRRIIAAFKLKFQFACWRLQVGFYV
jgi:hypothetical protein